MFAWCDFDVSVQYGANQPEYDIVIVQGDRMLKVSVKGSQDGSWGLTQNYKKGKTCQDKGKAPTLLVQRKGLSLKNAFRSPR
ncbi:hypothetical protein J2TS6_39720 [Paenibacillus albilobatus]|uniref:Uncharacterized protein n=1 Tax=Paenibacillus albilobatus TaxID=2716884 RepID=A0A920CAV3_9BACL|nr:hypothetical protein J2TS6_39720 [Paenibacillus albilobatus]